MASEPYPLNLIPFFTMARECNSGRRCFALLAGVPLTDDNFRMGPRPPQSQRFYAKCNQCRGGRPVPIALEPSRRCSKCHTERDLHLFQGPNGMPRPASVLTAEIIHQTCSICRERYREGRLRRRLVQEPLPEIPLRPRRVIRRPRHYDSSPEMDQPVRCSREPRVPDHEITVLRDFIDENGRRRVMCNYCRRRNQLPDRRNQVLQPQRVPDHCLSPQISLTLRF